MGIQKCKNCGTKFKYKDILKQRGGVANPVHLWFNVKAKKNLSGVNYNYLMIQKMTREWYHDIKLMTSE